MSLALVLIAIALLLAGALAAVLLSRNDRAALLAGSGGAALGCGVGLCGSVWALWQDHRSELRADWTLPLGQFHIALDALSSFFLLAAFLVCGLAAVYGIGYLQSYVGKKRLMPAVVFYNLLVLSILGVILARDAVLFLIAWEGMSITSFFLVCFEHEREEVRRGGYTYLIAAHLGGLFLFLLFMLLHRAAGSYDFGVIAALGGVPAGAASLCFVLALVGFGTKCGFWPLHIWLPDSYPVAPSHVAGVMSGIMSKLGIYGLLRILPMLGPPATWWGSCLLVLGGISGVLGLLYALGQRDLSRTLAYSSIENVGIIAMGLGLGLIAQSQGHGALAGLGYGGALLHVLNHGLMKGLLFQTAGSVRCATGSTELDALGGLSKRMPWTALLFLGGALAICGLPPLCGFVSEWLIYLAAFRGGTSLSTKWGALAIAAVPTLALIGGLAAACFLRTFGVAFLGTPRTAAPQHAQEAGVAMRGAMLSGALLCAALGLWPGLGLWLVQKVLVHALHLGALPSELLAGAQGVIGGLAFLLGLVSLLTLLRSRLLRGRAIETAATWGCGYADPTPRMQYTSTSFSEPLLTPLATAGSAHVEQKGLTGLFPTAPFYEEHRRDLAGERAIIPAARWTVAALSRMRVLQQGQIQLYLTYIFVTVIALLLWQIAGVAEK